MDKKKAIEKIKKCLRLAKSANEFEAAQALKHAQSLMYEYQINDFDVEMADVMETGVRIPKSYSTWQHILFTVCKRAFGCDGYILENYDINQGKTLTYYKFYGVAPKPELAAYAYNVLIRQLRTARRHYLATTLKRVKIAKNRAFRADQFCLGWISAVDNKINAFAGTEKEQAKLNAYKKNLGKMTSVAPRSVTVKNQVIRQAYHDENNGYDQGKHAQLNHAMPGGEQYKMLEQT
ncbi:DUF2786 domain-containing protein [Neisseriaceae bacterium ESL0693]|nr:DUF2786 domain-containing protein [Neisseriaceae bacterium ESL0693]